MISRSIRFLLVDWEQSHKETHGQPSLTSTSGLRDVISTGTLALVRGCLFFVILILGLVFLALRRERPIRAYLLSF